MMTVEEKPDVTYNDVGGCKEQIEKMREVCMAFLILICTGTHLENLKPFSNYFYFYSKSGLETKMHGLMSFVLLGR